jgi:uncharacterized protein YqfA (UPF0365 family)
MFTKTKTVDTVLAAFNTAIADLERIGKEQAAAANTARVEADRQILAAKASEAEVARAASVASFRALVT